MPTIKARKQADGSLRYTVVVRIRRQGKVLHQEAKTFAHRSAAERWGKHREVDLENPANLVRAQQPSTKLSNLIRWYIDSFQHVSKWQRSKQSQLEFLEKHLIGTADALHLGSATLVDHVRSRRAKGAGPTTVANDLTWIGVVLRAAKSVQNLPVDPRVVEEARNACRELRLVGKSRRRERRPTPQELVKLDEYFCRRDRRSRTPMRDIMWFAIHSARREAERRSAGSNGRTTSSADGLDWFAMPSIQDTRKVTTGDSNSRPKPGQSSIVSPKVANTSFLTILKPSPQHSREPVTSLASRTYASTI